MFDIGFPRDWSSLKKLIWLKAAIGGGGASGIWKTVTGTLLHITDALPSPMQKCEVRLEPIQDLHGQDAPYPAGGGVNKSQNIYYKPAGNNIFPGTDDADGYPYYLTSGQTYTFSCKIAGNTGFSAYIREENQQSGTRIATTSAVNVAFSFTPSLTGNYRLVLVFPSGNQGMELENIQLELGSSATPYKPFANICPITGWTGCEVRTANENLIDVQISSGATRKYYLNTGFLLKKGVTYTLKSSVSTGIAVYFRNIDDTSSTENSTVIGNGRAVATCTPNEDVLSSFKTYASSASAYPENFILELTTDENAQVVAHQGTTLSVTFPDSAGAVYGCTVDLVSGELTVDRAIVDMGTLSWVYVLWNNKNYTFAATPSEMKSGGVKSICSQYPRVSASVMYSDIVDSCYCVNQNLIRVVDSRYTDATSFKTAMSGVQLVYELATPVTYQLTPQEISTLVGENNVWSDANGDITLIYKAQAE